MRQPTKKELLDFIHRALDELEFAPGLKGDGLLDIRNVEALETMDLPQLRLLTSIILALGYETPR